MPASEHIELQPKRAGERLLPLHGNGDGGPTAPDRQLDELFDIARRCAAQSSTRRKRFGSFLL
jgi:hypothetical protein